MGASFSKDRDCGPQAYPGLDYSSETPPPKVKASSVGLAECGSPLTAGTDSWWKTYVIPEVLFSPKMGSEHNKVQGGTGHAAWAPFVPCSPGAFGCVCSSDVVDTGVPLRSQEAACVTWTPQPCQSLTIVPGIFSLGSRSQISPLQRGQGQGRGEGSGSAPGLWPHHGETVCDLSFCFSKVHVRGPSDFKLSC